MFLKIQTKTKTFSSFQPIKTKNLFVKASQKIILKKIKLTTQIKTKVKFINIRLSKISFRY